MAATRDMIKLKACLLPVILQIETQTLSCAQACYQYLIHIHPASITRLQETLRPPAPLGLQGPESHAFTTGQLRDLLLESMYDGINPQVTSTCSVTSARSYHLRELRELRAGQYPPNKWLAELYECSSGAEWFGLEEALNPCFDKGGCALDRFCFRGRQAQREPHSFHLAHPGMFSSSKFPLFAIYWPLTVGESSINTSNTCGKVDNLHGSGGDQ